MDFRTLNLQEWLTKHPYAVFRACSDTLVIRKTVVGTFVWTMVRFNFQEGYVALAHGKNIEDLESQFGHECSSKTKAKVIDQQTKLLARSDGVHKTPRPNCGVAMWKIWGETLREREMACAGPLHAAMTSIFVDDEDSMVWKSLKLFFKAWRDDCEWIDFGAKFLKSPSCASINPRVKVSLKERCALSHLHNNIREVRLKSLRILLNLLLEVEGHPCVFKSQNIVQCESSWTQTRSTPGSARSQGHKTPNLLRKSVQRDGDMEEKENMIMFSDLMAVLEKRPNVRAHIGETERALHATAMKWTQFEGTKSDRLHISYHNKTSLRPQLHREQILEWLSNCFIETLLKEGGVCVDFISEKQGPCVDVHEMVNACLRVIQVVPGDGVWRIVKCLVSLLPDAIKKVVVLKRRSSQTPREVLTPSPLQGPEASNVENMESIKTSLHGMVHICKLVALLVSSSVPIASGLANMNGLPLIVDMYLTLVSEFPINSNSTSTSGGCASIKPLPGEVPMKMWKSQTLCSIGFNNQCPTKLCNGKISYGSLHPTNVTCKGSTSITSSHALEKSLPREACKMSRLSQAYSVLKACSNYSKVSHVGFEDDEGASNKRQRLYNLPLQLMFAPAHHDVNLNGDQEDFVKGMHGCNKTIPNNDPCPPPIGNTIFNLVCEARFHLLKTLAFMLGSHSITLNAKAHNLAHKLCTEAGTSLCQGFLSDLLGTQCNNFKANVEFKKIIFKAIFLIDNIVEKDNQLVGPLPKAQHIEEGPWWSGPGPPCASPQKNFMNAMLVDLRSRMDIIITCMDTAIFGCVSPAKMGVLYGNFCEDRYNHMMKHRSLMEKNTLNDRISRLYMNLASLIAILFDYTQYWPENGIQSTNILNCCWGQIAHTLTHLASFGSPSNWAPSQILTMHSILKFLVVCVHDIVIFQPSWVGNYQTNYVNRLWDLLINTPAHWNCIQTYSNWLMLDICPGCLIQRMKDSQTSLQEPIRMYYCAVGENFGTSGISRNMFTNPQDLEFLLSIMFAVPHLVVALVQCKLDAQKNNLCMGNINMILGPNVLWFLEKIMHPIDGLLLMAIKINHMYTNTPNVAEGNISSQCEECTIDTQPRKSQSKHAGELCTYCAKMITDSNLVAKLKFNIEQECLTLLVGIFGLKFLTPGGSELDRYNGEGSINVNENPFLFHKYVSPFLGIIITKFMDVYNLSFQANQPPSSSLMSESNPSTMHHRHSVGTYHGNARVYVGKLTTPPPSDDASFLCSSYAQVMLSVAQNLTKDASQTFQELRIMDFLVKEIALEYEFSQILCAKLVTKTCGQSSLNRPCSSIEGLRGRESSSSSSGSREPISTLRTITSDYGIASNMHTKGDVSVRWNTPSMCYTTKDRTKVSSSNQHDLALSSTSGCHEFMLQWTMTETLSTPLQERNENTRSKIGSSSTIPTTRMPRKPREPCQYDKDNAKLSTLVAKSYNSNLVWRKPKLEDKDIGALQGCCEMKNLKKEKFVYSGRFVDLNEEVERELAAEEEEGNGWACKRLNHLNQELNGFNNIKYPSSELGSESKQKKPIIHDYEECFMNCDSLLPIPCDKYVMDNEQFLRNRPIVPKLDFTRAIEKNKLKPLDDSCKIEVSHDGSQGQCSSGDIASVGKNTSRHCSRHVSYEEERLRRRIYHNADLHVLLLELFIFLMLNPQYEKFLSFISLQNPLLPICHLESRHASSIHIIIHPQSCRPSPTHMDH